MSDNQNNQKRSEKSDTPNSRNSGSLSFPSVPRLLCIVGPTATGKTAHALKLASKQPSILVSADSRQVYRGMDIVTGKDHPRDVPIFGVDIVDPDQSCSVSVWYDAVMSHITAAWGKGILPIVVGGTGLYVKALTNGIGTLHIPPNEHLRSELAGYSVTELQDKLHQVGPQKLTSMNESDRANSRRLTRAIEICDYRESHPERALASRMGNSDSTIIGLRYYDDSNYRSTIKARVRARLAAGAAQETKRLLSQYGEHIQSLSAIGYRSLIAYVKGEASEAEMVDRWVADELAYAKRQIVWFKKQPVEWQFVDKPGSI